MKKILFLIFASLLVLGACGQNGDNSNKDDNKKSESKSDKKSNGPKKSDSKDKSNKNTNYENNKLVQMILTMILLAINLKAHLKITIAKLKVIMVIMNDHKVNKLKQHNKTTISNKLITTNKHKIIMVT